MREKGSRRNTNLKYSSVPAAYRVHLVWEAEPQLVEPRSAQGCVLPLGLRCPGLPVLVPEPHLPAGAPGLGDCAGHHPHLLCTRGTCRDTPGTCRDTPGTPQPHHSLTPHRGSRSGTPHQERSPGKRATSKEGASAAKGQKGKQAKGQQGAKSARGKKGQKGRRADGKRGRRAKGERG